VVAVEQDDERLASYRFSFEHHRLRRPFTKRPRTASLDEGSFTALTVALISPAVMESSGGRRRGEGESEMIRRSRSTRRIYGGEAAPPLSHGSALQQRFGRQHARREARHTTVAPRYEGMKKSGSAAIAERRRLGGWPGGVSLPGLAPRSPSRPGRRTPGQPRTPAF
jgi:hypothetical protein